MIGSFVMTSGSHEVLELFIERYLDQDTLTVAVAGEVDIDSAWQLDGALQDGVARPGVSVVVADLAGVPFLDSTGIRVLLAGHHRAEECGTSLVVTNVQPVVRRVLEVMAVFTLLTTEHGRVSRDDRPQKAG
ncbi:stage II sporulation protein AA (anti-sigma F factor antagonist) [Asanoa hainanensis]|uniref:Anti-sigma factor antagonist n=1 Tax=Asanoa hainanensis TaxID=560556 RepID=A0A239N509_9ACTN|nr:STAS domain-containing protein [Asanoa hainanensis]SNT50016.1 stage II sporulation protein AA (anti-sigma F factor antagonist) [Asanoa hainanensis]